MLFGEASGTDYVVGKIERVGAVEIQVLVLEEASTLSCLVGRGLQLFQRPTNQGQ